MIVPAWADAQESVKAARLRCIARVPRT